MLYPATTGRNFDEVLRVVDSLLLTATKKVATPADWQNGGSCMVVPSVKAGEIPNLFPKGVTIHDVPSGKKYLRTTPQPWKKTGFVWLKSNKRIVKHLSSSDMVSQISNSNSEYSWVHQLEKFGVLLK